MPCKHEYEPWEWKSGRIDLSGEKCRVCGNVKANGTIEAFSEHDELVLRSVLEKLEAVVDREGGKVTWSIGEEHTEF